MTEMATYLKREVELWSVRCSNTQSSYIEHTPFKDNQSDALPLFHQRYRSNTDRREIRSKNPNIHCMLSNQIGLTFDINRRVGLELQEPLITRRPTTPGRDDGFQFSLKTDVSRIESAIRGLPLSGIHSLRRHLAHRVLTIRTPANHWRVAQIPTNDSRGLVACNLWNGG